MRVKSAEVPFTRSRTSGWILRLAALAVFVLFSPGDASSEDDFDYQVKFPRPPYPQTGSEALLTLSARASAVIQGKACEQELWFWRRVTNHLPQEDKDKDNAKDQTYEDDLATIIGKMMEVTALTPFNVECIGHQQIKKEGFVEGFADQLKDINGNSTGFKESDWNDLIKGSLDSMNNNMKSLYGDDDCGKIITRAGPGGTGPTTDDVLDIDYSVTNDCLRAQINTALNFVQRRHHPGSSGNPCYMFGGKTHGEWDVSVRDLTRIVYLDERSRGILNREVRAHIENDLLTIDLFPLRPPSYSLFSCGDQEESTGSPDERADGSDWTDKALDTLGDVTKWAEDQRWLVWLLVFAALAVAPLLAAAGGPAAAAAGALAALAAAGAGEGLLADAMRIPETENHQLMIESSRYLKNQTIIKALKAEGRDASRYEDAQKELKELFFKKFQDIFKNDFEEYNARPYQRYSITAILNLADFAFDGDVRRAATMVLEAAAAKFAVGSIQNRRLVPFRRLMDVIEKNIDKGQGIFDLHAAADHMVALMLLYSGQTQRLTNPHGEVSVSIPSTGEMVYAASSQGQQGQGNLDVQPDEIILDLAISKDVSYDQRIRHDGVEIYSSSPSFLISAGGISTGAAPDNTASLLLPSLRPQPFSRIVDRGAAVPTTLMFKSEGRLLHTSLDSMIRIEGAKVTVHDLVPFTGDPTKTYDHNLCVWRGFACGLNILIPPEIENCLKKPPPGRPDEWRFLDTTACPDVFRGDRKTYVVIYREDCRSSDTGCRKKFGFIEAVDDPQDQIDEFIKDVLDSNRPGPIRQGMAGEYRSASGHDIKFDCEAHQQDSDRWGIEEVDGTKQPGLHDWPVAHGERLEKDVNGSIVATGNIGIEADRDGLIVITDSRGRKLELDFRDATNPKRTHR